MNSNDDQTTQRLYQRYRDPNSQLFLQSDTNKIYEAAKKDARIYPVTRKEILAFKQSVETASRNFEARTLRARARYTTYRRWLTFSPLSILLGTSDPKHLYEIPSYHLCVSPKLIVYHSFYLGDLCFLPGIRKKNNGRFVILILMDAFRSVGPSHFVFFSFQVILINS